MFEHTYRILDEERVLNKIHVYYAIDLPKYDGTRASTEESFRLRCP